jgi:hypothetical protein
MQARWWYVKAKIEIQIKYVPSNGPPMDIQTLVDLVPVGHHGADFATRRIKYGHGFAIQSHRHKGGK